VRVADQGYRPGLLIRVVNQPCQDSGAKKPGLGVGLGLGIPLMLAVVGIGVFACWTTGRRGSAGGATTAVAAEQRGPSEQKPPRYPQASSPVAQRPVYYVAQKPTVQAGYPVQWGQQYSASPNRRLGNRCVEAAVSTWRLS
jgi:hypothetical protein